MSQDKKFIIVTSESVADQMVSCGFNLLYMDCGKYVFINESGKNFNFSTVDKSNVFFTNKLNI